MPDLDVVNPIAPGWHKAYKLILGGGGPEEVGQAVLAALAKRLRRGHGLGALDEVETVLGNVMNARLSLPDALARLRSIERASGGERHCKVVVRAAQSIIAETAEDREAPENLRVLIATRSCGELLAHYLFGPAWNEVLQERFTAPETAQDFSDMLASLLEPRLAKLGESLARNPEATRLRAPAIQSPGRRSTAELLDETIVV